MNPNLNCLSHWQPLIEAAGLPTPRTEIIRTDVALHELLYDGKTPEGFDEFCTLLLADCHKIGFPVFLRTGQGSGKHQWERTCYLTDPAKLPQHVFNLVEWSECAGFLGLPHNVWCVRQMIPTTPLFRAFRGFPVTREFRCFWIDGDVKCCHPYWPAMSIEEGGYPDDPDWRAKLAAASEPGNDEGRLRDLARAAGLAVGGGNWSIDLLQDSEGRYWVTDMAVAEESFHWEGCPNGGAR